jgi:FkbM family methyltransferase
VLRTVLGRLGIYQPVRNVYQKMLRPDAAAHRQRVRGFFGQFIRHGDLVFDVGANDGRYTDAFLELGARVVAVEPNPSLAGMLRERFRAQVEQVAVGAEPGSAELHLSDVDILSTLSTEWMDIARREHLTNEWSGKTITVSVSTLDALIARHGVPSYVKIDVEGYEPQALHGLSQPIATVSFEVQGPALHMAADCVKLLDGLAPYVFSVSPLDQHALATGWLPGAQLLERLPGLLGAGHGDVFARLAQKDPARG